MTQLDIVKAFLEDPIIQQKYGLTSRDITEMTMNSTYNRDTQVIVNLVRRLVAEIDDKSKTVNLVAAALNQNLENALR